MSKEKLKSYLGLAKKANAIIYGKDSIKDFRKPIYCVILCVNASDKLKFHINNLCESKKINLKVLKSVSIDEMLGTENCKVIGVINPNFAKAILENEE